MVREGSRGSNPPINHPNRYPCATRWTRTRNYPRPSVNQSGNADGCNPYDTFADRNPFSSKETARMPTIRLTQKAVDALKPPADGRVEYWDTHLPGFGLRVAAPRPGA